MYLQISIENSRIYVLGFSSTVIANKDVNLAVNAQLGSLHVPIMSSIRLYVYLKGRYGE